MTNITIDLEKLTEDQLEALKVVDAEAVKKELDRRINESIYTEEEMRKFKIFSDLSKAYFFLKPMYDNMRNNDVKKTITASEIIPVLEKVFRHAKANKISYEPYKPVVEEEATPAPVEEAAPAPVEETTPIEEYIDKKVAQEPVAQPVPEPQPLQPAPAPVTPEAIVSAIPPVPAAAPRPIVQPLTAPVMVQPISAVPPMPKASSVDITNMSPEEINAVMQNIPVIPNI